MRPFLETGDRQLRSYLTGFVLAAVLTVIPFGLVVLKVVPQMPALALVAVLAAAQIVVHLRYFLHLDFSAAARGNRLTLAFAAIVIFIMVGGTVWIMFDLHYRMMT